MGKEFKKRPKLREVKKLRRGPTLRETRPLLRKGPAKKLRDQTRRLKKLPKLTLTARPKEQVTSVVKLAKKLKAHAVGQARGKLRGELRKSNILELKFGLKDPSYSQGSKGKLVFIFKGLGAGLKYRNKRKGVELRGTVKKGSGSRTPVDVQVKGKLRIPGQPNSTIHFAYRHDEMRFTIGGIYRLKQAGKLVGKTAQLDLRGSASISPNENRYTAVASYGHRTLQLQLRTNIIYQKGKVEYQVVGGLQLLTF